MFQINLSITFTLTLLFLLDCKSRSPPSILENAIAIENLSREKTSSGFAASLKIYLPDGSGILMGGDSPSASSQLHFPKISSRLLSEYKNLKLLNKKSSDGEIQLLKYKDQQTVYTLGFISSKSDHQNLGDLENLNIDYLFLEQPSQRLLEAVAKLPIKRAILCSGKFPKKISKQLRNRIRIVRVKRLTDLLPKMNDHNAAIFFFSNQSSFLG